MSVNRISPVLAHLRQMAESVRVEEASDRELTEWFARDRNDAAFRTLFERHGPMVLGVCRRVLKNEQDAEDALQATFLVLARKAAGLQQQDSVGSWLYGVAYRTALKARTARVRRATRDAAAHVPAATDPLADLTVREAQAIVDEEIARLSEKLRAPLVLCCLEGLARDEAAKQLGWPVTLVKSRLEQARSRLHDRLVRRGLTLSAGLLSVGLLTAPAQASVPAALATATLKAALALAAGSSVRGMVSTQALWLFEGMVRTMLWTKIRTIAAAALLVVSLGAGATAGFVATRPGDEGDNRNTQATASSARQQPGQTKVAQKVQLKPESLKRWGQAEVVVIARLAKVDRGPVAQSNPPIYNHRLHFEVDKTLRGLAKKGETLTGNHSIKQALEPVFPQGGTCVVALGKLKGQWIVQAVDVAEPETLAQAELACAVPVGWQMENNRLCSPWTQLGDKAWPVGAKGQTSLVCSITGRPALLVGAGIELNVEPVLPAVQMKYGNPDGDGEFKITVKNTTDKPLSVPALLSDGQKVLWDDSFVVLCQGKTYAIPGATGVKKAPQPTTLKPGEVMSTVINTFKLQGPEWPRGGYRIEFVFALGEKAVTQSFYYLSKHHDPIRERVQSGK